MTLLLYLLIFPFIVLVALLHNCYIIGSDGVIVKTDYFGGYTRENSNTTNFLAGASCPSSTVCYAAGVSGTIVKTADGGTTWTPQASGTTADFYAINCPDVAICYAVGPNGVIRTTTNNGSTWLPQTSGTNNTRAVARSGRERIGKEKG